RPCAAVWRAGRAIGESFLKHVQGLRRPTSALARAELGSQDVEPAVQQAAQVRQLLFFLTRRAQTRSQLVIRRCVESVDEGRVEKPVETAACLLVHQVPSSYCGARRLRPR